MAKDRPLVALLVVTHGKLALELVEAARRILGPLEAFEAVSIDWDTDVSEARDRLEQAVRKVDRGRGVLLLTDMFGGTPSNMSLSFHREHRVEVVTGLNLPMLIKLAALKEVQSLEELATFIKNYGQRNISLASEILPEGEG